MSRDPSAPPTITEIADVLRLVADPAAWDDSEQTRREAAELLRRLQERGMQMEIVYLGVVTTATVRP